MAILLRDITNVIRFSSKVEIILQEQELFPNRENDKVVWAKEYNYASDLEFNEYLDYKVCMLAQKDDYIQIYICRFGE